MNNIDINSEEFKNELEKTIKFTDKVIKQFNWVYNPDIEINQGIQLGLTRNKMMFGKRFCPCFMIEKTEDNKYKSVDDRICPCKPAIEKELPEDGVCHCQIFCTPEFAKNKMNEETIEEVIHEHSRGLTKEESEHLLLKEQFDSEEIEALLESRELGFINFNIIDVRELMENRMREIVGTNYLVPTSSFYDSLEKQNISKSVKSIVYCHIGSRSAYVYNVMKDLGYNVGNITHGISGYRGKIERGNKEI